MPYLKKIVIQDFRNILLQELDFSPNINCISGGNGAGKTNLLEAVYYLSMTRSILSGGDHFNFRSGCRRFALSGSYGQENGGGFRISVQVEEGGEKKLRRDDKAYGRISDHIGLVPVVPVSPADSALVSESGEERRRFANAVLSQMDAAYLGDMQQYNKLLAQRNRLLKDAACDELLLDTFDDRLSDCAGRIFEIRRCFTDDLLPVVQQYYGRISGGSEQIAIRYESDLAKRDFRSTLRDNHARDRAYGHTTAGIHRDDFAFSLDGRPLRKCGSQGQQKSFLVALKFAQYDLMKARYGFAPILLLDDLFDKLDISRTGHLLEMVAGSDFGQIFISDTDKARTMEIVEKITADRSFFEASAGTFTRIDGYE